MTLYILIYRFVDVEKLRNHVINVHLMQKQMRKQYNMINVSKVKLVTDQARFKASWTFLFFYASYA